MNGLAASAFVCETLTLYKRFLFNLVILFLSSRVYPATRKQQNNSLSCIRQAGAENTHNFKVVVFVRSVFKYGVRFVVTQRRRRPITSTALYHEKLYFKVIIYTLIAATAL